MSYRVGYVLTTAGLHPRVVREQDPQDFATIERAAKHMRRYKNRGMTAWVETDGGTHVPVAGAKRAPQPSWFSR